MVDQILGGAEGMPCMSLSNSNAACTNEKNKKEVFNSQIFIEDPTRLQAPVIVSYFNEKHVTFQDLAKRRWRFRKPKYEIKERFNICRWYKRKRALKSLRDQTKKEQKRERRKQREEYERVRINDIIRWEYGKQQKAIREEDKKKKWEKRERERINDIMRWEYERQQKAIKEEEKRKQREENERERKNNIIRSEYAKQQKAVINEPRLRFGPPDEKKKVVTIKETKYKPKPWSSLKKIKFPIQKKEKKKRAFSTEKSATAKPRARSKRVSVKKYKQKDSITNRFVNCFYRVCCQFYCCLTCVLFVALIIMFIL